MTKPQKIRLIKFIKYTQEGNTLHLSDKFNVVNILYKGVIVDDEGLPFLNEKELYSKPSIALQRPSIATQPMAGGGLPLPIPGQRRCASLSPGPFILNQAPLKNIGTEAGGECPGMGKNLTCDSNKPRVLDLLPKSRNLSSYGVIAAYS
jgi:hypothetical protein